MLALVGMFVGFSAFKYGERVDDPENGWYSITPDEDEPADQTLQHINNFADTNPPVGDCEVDNEAEPCQVELDLTNFKSTIPISGMTVSQAADSGAVIGLYANRLE